MSGVRGLASWCLLGVDRRWTVLAVAATLALLLGSGTALVGAVDADTPGPRGDDRLTIALDTAGETLDVGLPGRLVVGLDDRFVPRSHPAIAGEFRYRAADGSPPDAVTLEARLVVERHVAGGRLWRYEERIDDPEVEAAAEGEVRRVRFSVPVTDLLDRHRPVDDELGVTDGDVRRYVEGRLVRDGVVVDRARVEVATQGDHYGLSTHDPVAPEGPTDGPDGAIDWGPPVGVAGAVGVAVLGATRLGGVFPLTGPTLERHRRRAIRWRHRRRIVAVESPVDLAGAAVVDDPRDLVRIARDRRRPILADRRGTFAVSDGGRTYATRPLDGG